MRPNLLFNLFICCAFSTCLFGGALNIPFTEEETISKEQKLPIDLNITLTSDVTCPGGNDGAALAIGLNGLPPYSYEWSNGISIAAALNLSAGTYTVTVTDLLGDTASASITISEPPPLEINIDNQINIDCNNASGSLSVSASGGTPGYLYLWSDGTIGPTATNLSAGIYTVTTTDDNGCITVEDIEVTTDIELPTVSATVNGELDCNNLTLNLDGTGSSTGGIYTYLWTTLDGNITAGETTLSPTVDAEGTYTLLVTNNETGCSDSTDVVVTADIELPTVSATVNGELDCNTLTLNLDGTGSSTGGLHTYLWTTLDGNITAGETTLSPTVDAEGTYTLLVTNNDNGCTDSTDVVVTADIQLPTVSATVNGELNCSMITIDLDGSGSSIGPDYVYLWTTIDGNIVSGENTLSPTVNVAGTYTLEVTNTDNDCSDVADVVVTADADLPVVDIDINGELNCNNLTLDLDATGSSTGSDFIYLWTTIDGNILSGETTLLPTIDAEGTYTLEITNTSTGCTNVLDIFVDADLDLPSIDVDVDSDLNCNNPLIDLDASASSSGGIYTYLWTTLDGNIVAGENTLIATVDAEGTYTLEILNTESGCSNTIDIDVDADLDLPIVDAIVDVELGCGLLSIDLDATGSSTGPNFIYLWTTVDGHIVAGENTLTPTVDAAGTYTLEITNTDNGCSNSIDVEVSLSGDTPVADASTDQQVDCNNTTITLDGSGSSTGANYTYLWTTTDGNIVSGETTLNPTVDAGGTYTLLVTNTDNGCTNTAEVTVTEDIATPVASATAQGELNCSNSTIIIDASSSSQGSGITYEWTTNDGNIVSGGDTDQPTVNAPGTYTLTVTNTDNGCSSSTSVQVTGTAVLSVAVDDVTHIDCAGSSTGAISIEVNGGTAPYTYNWSNGMTSADISGLAAGIYTVTIEDDAGCMAVVDVEIIESDAFDVEVETVAAIPGLSNGIALINVTGGTPPYTYIWSTGDTTASVQGLDEGTYTVEITDANGCSSGTIEVVISAQSAANQFRAYLTGRSEVLPVASNGRGEIFGSLNGNELTITGTFSNLDGAFDATIAGGSHIHIGYAGQNGPVEFTLIPIMDADLKGGVYLGATNTFTLDNDQMQALQERRMYVNIHTTSHASGEIRGQLLPIADENYATNLFGSYEMPTVVSMGSGALVMELHGDSLVVSGSFMNLKDDFDASIAGGAHLHSAMAGSNGSVTIALNATTDADLRGGVFKAEDNTFILSQQERDMLEARGLYANIHTLAHSSGELRGQVTGEAQVVFRAFMSGSNETQVVTSEATGMILGELDGNILKVSGSFDSLESDINTAIAGGAHLHSGMAGMSGGAMFELNMDADANNRGGTFPVDDNEFTLDANQRAMLMARGLYANIHSMNHAGGEIRGQLLPESQVVLNAFLSGNFEVDPASTRAHGMLKGELNGNRLIVSGTFDDLSSALNVAIAGGAHIHSAMAGSNGDVEFPLVVDADTDLRGGAFQAADNTFMLDSTQHATIMARGMYANIHSLEYPAGELRGQYLPDANMYFMAMLSGSSETNPVNSEAFGAVAIEINGDQAIASGSFNELSSNLATSVAGGAHLHTAMAGSNGGVKFSLASSNNGNLTRGTFDATANIFTLTQGQLDTFRKRMFYANVHSENNTSGEIRGQVLPLANSYFTTTLAGINSVQPVTSTGMGALKLELTGDVLVATGSFSNLSSDFNASVAGGSHLHIGGPSTTGGVEVRLDATVDAGMRAGVYEADNNSYVLTQSQIDALYDGELYFNLHTVDHPAGEIRGQLLQEVNAFPEAGAAIQLPTPGSTIDIEGAGTTDFTATWLPSSDPDGNEVVYIWQLGLDSDFNTIIYQENTGNDAVFVTDYTTLDVLLDANGVSVGSTANLYHRVVVSDGSNHTASDGEEVNLRRGTLTSTSDIGGLVNSMKVFPNPFTDGVPVQIHISANEFVEADIEVWNTSGQLIFRKEAGLAPGDNWISLDLTRASNEGFLFVQVKNEEGKLIGVRRLSKMQP